MGSLPIACVQLQVGALGTGALVGLGCSGRGAGMGYFVWERCVIVLVKPPGISRQGTACVLLTGCATHLPMPTRAGGCGCGNGDDR